MIDISDGLSSEIQHLCDASETGCRLYTDMIPIAPETKEAAVEMNLEPVTIALNGGEDYELLFTVPLTCYDRIITIPDITSIGHMTSRSEGNYLVMPDGSLTEIQSLGWNSLKG